MIQLTKQQAIEALAEADADALTSDQVQRLFINGVRGYDTYSEEEIYEAYWDAFQEKLSLIDR